MRIAAAACAVLVASACLSDSTGPPHAPTTNLLLRADLSGTAVAVLVAEVTAPDIATPLIFNIPIVQPTATGTQTGRVTATRPGHTMVVATYGGTAGTATLAVAGWFASPTGTSGGDGSRQPWDLQTALNGASGAVHPGDTIWLRGGTYAGT